MALDKSIYKFDDYKDYLRYWISEQPNKGRGQLRKFSEGLRVHSTLVSQVVNGSRDFSLEQARAITDILQLSKLEARYFLLLVQKAKAGSQLLKATFEEELKEIQTQEEDLRKKFNSPQSFDEKARAEFYSNWTYSAVRLCTDIPYLKSPSDIATALGLSEALVKKRLDFLVRHGLCRFTRGRYILGSSETHVNRDSPFVTNHHRNWRLKALEQGIDLKTSEIMFSAPLTISKKNAKEVSGLISDFIEKLKKLSIHSESEEMRVLNIDWVQIVKQA